MILVTCKIDDNHLVDIQQMTSMNVKNAKISELSTSELNKVEIVLSYGNYNDVITPEDLDQLPNLKWIQLLSSGTDQLPLSTIEERKIILTTARGIHGIPISEYVIAMILYFTKKISHYNQSKLQKNWNPSGTEEVYQKKIGILGTGVIGKEIANKSSALGMIPYGLNRSGQQWEEFKQVYPLREIETHIKKFDIIVAALPSNKGTIQLVNKDLIDQMKDGVIFINVGRGDLVVEKDLLNALKNNKFKGVALDVFNEEPLSENSPLWEIENLIITPHISSSTKRYIPRALSLFYDNYKKYSQNELV